MPKATTCEQTDPINVDGHAVQACIVPEIFGDAEGSPYKEVPSYECSDSDPVGERKEVKAVDELDADGLDHVWTFDLTEFARGWAEEFTVATNVMLTGAVPEETGEQDSWRVIFAGPKAERGIKTKLVYEPGEIALPPTLPPATTGSDTVRVRQLYNDDRFRVRHDRFRVRHDRLGGPHDRERCGRIAEPGPRKPDPGRRRARCDRRTARIRVARDARRDHRFRPRPSGGHRVDHGHPARRRAGEDPRAQCRAQGRHRNRRRRHAYRTWSRTLGNRTEGIGSGRKASFQGKGITTRDP